MHPPPGLNVMWAVERETTMEENTTARIRGEITAAIEIFMEKINIGTQIGKKKTAKRPDPVETGARRKIIIRATSNTNKSGAG